MTRCIVCSLKRVSVLLDLGKLPISRNYIHRGENIYGDNYYHLCVGQCKNCGFIQLVNLIPFEKLLPKNKWIIKYTEPEAHLDELAHAIEILPGITKESHILGISYKDDTLLKRLEKNEFRNTKRLKRKDLLISNTLFGVETVQARFSADIATKIRKQRGGQDVCIIRHSLEHSYNPVALIEAAKILVSNDGYLVIEVPSVEKALTYCDYTTIWEEHAVYFTEKLFRWFIEYCGLSIYSFKKVKYPLEDSLVAIVKKSARRSTPLAFAQLQGELESGEMFKSRYLEVKRKLHEELSAYNNIVLFGAGHLSTLWMHIFSLEKFISYCIDDDKHKVGLHMPGSHIEIQKIPKNVSLPISLCLLAANPDKHEKMLQMHKRFFHKVKKIRSIFPQQHNYIANLHKT